MKQDLNLPVGILWEELPNESSQWRVKPLLGVARSSTISPLLTCKAPGVPSAAAIEAPWSPKTAMKIIAYGPRW